MCCYWVNPIGIFAKQNLLMSFRIFVLFALFVVVFGCQSEPNDTADDLLLATLKSLAGEAGLDHFIMPDSRDLASIPQDPLNPLTPAKVQLGKLLFHETALASDGNFTETVGTYSCASCHHVQGGFQANLPQGIGDGGMGFGSNGEGRQFNPFCDKEEIDVQPIRTPTAMNGAFQTNMLWNGQFGATGVNIGTEDVWPTEGPISVNRLGFEGLEIQAIAGLSVHRFGLSLTEQFIMDNEYEELFDVAFFDVPVDERYSKTTGGLAIAAYERTLLSNEAPFQTWLRGEAGAMTDQQKRGALVFFESGCASCHDGPALNSMSFHAFGFDDLFTGSYGPSEVINVDEGDSAHMGRGGFTKYARDMYKFKVPQLYNMKDSPFFGHGSSFNDLEELVRYKVNGVPQNDKVPASQISTEFINLGLSESEILDLVEFLENGLYDPNLKRYLPNAVPSGNCFPNNDALSKVDLDCI